MEGIADCFYEQKVCSSIVKNYRDNIVLRAVTSSQTGNVQAQIPLIPWPMANHRMLSVRRLLPHA